MRPKKSLKQFVQGACNRFDGAVHDMGVNLGSFDVRMPHELLDCPYVYALFKHMGGKTVTKCTTGHPLYDSGPANGSFYGFLKP
jgi:hypothetical protein